MSSIAVYHEAGPDMIKEKSSEGVRIAEILAGAGVRFERWQASAVLPYQATQEQVLDAYRESVDRLMSQCGFHTVDVIHMKPDHPEKVAFRGKFLQEHTHTEDEVRFFVEGKGLFCMHIGEQVYATLCEKGDLISVPAGTPHWFDMGTQPEFSAIRFFNNPEGWVAQFTGSSIADRFPKMSFEAKAVLTDIEGTTGSISFVKEVLFPYAKAQLVGYVTRQGGRPEVRAILEAARQEAGLDEKAVDGEVAQKLISWIDEDRKVTPLKELQGLIWEEGYRSGAFTAHVYEDAYQGLRRWKAAGKKLYVYSSGSVKAQHLMFEHTVYGDLRSLFAGYFDTRSGPKKEAASYGRIAQEMGFQPGEVLFLSDVVAELSAARQAGMSTALLVREGTVPDDDAHDRFTNFDRIPLV